MALAAAEPMLWRMAIGSRTPAGRTRFGGVLAVAAVAVALAVAFVVWLVVRGDGDSGTTPATTRVAALGPVAASAERLRALADEAGHPIYWVGPRAGMTYELTRTSAGQIFVRYLPEGAEVGNEDRAYTIVGTYPVANATRVLRQLAEKPGEKRLAAPGGAIAVYGTARPANVYVAYPGSNLQIEVFDPSPERARELVRSGQVVPVD